MNEPNPIEPSNQLRTLRQGRRDYRWQQAQLYGSEPIHGRMDSDGRYACGADADALGGVTAEHVTCAACRAKDGAK